MTQSPPGRRAPRSRRAVGADPEKWLEVPGWRKPLDTLLALVVTPAAANVDRSPEPQAAPETTHHSSAPVADATTDPSQWIAGPVYTGGPAAPTSQVFAAAESEVVAAPIHHAPAPRVVPK